MVLDIGLEVQSQFLISDKSAYFFGCFVNTFQGLEKYNSVALKKPLAETVFLRSIIKNVLIESRTT